MERFIEFLMQVHSSFTAWAKYPRESMRIATMEGYYVSDYLGINEKGKVQLAALPFLPTALPAWDLTFFDEEGNLISGEEFTDMVEEIIQDLIEQSALDDEELVNTNTLHSTEEDVLIDS